mmetsp:Transcript_97696/g.276362  ORF Transcript_97696/g.276362 Transcript_97696/m.276362 type:complete len:271 (+) Transcript_97696:883-1695(+)
MRREASRRFGYLPVTRRSSDAFTFVLFAVAEAQRSCTGRFRYRDLTTSNMNSTTSSALLGFFSRPVRVNNDVSMSSTSSSTMVSTLPPMKYAMVSANFLALLGNNTNSALISEGVEIKMAASWLIASQRALRERITWQPISRGTCGLNHKALSLPDNTLNNHLTSCPICTASSGVGTRIMACMPTWMVGWSLAISGKRYPNVLPSPVGACKMMWSPSAILGMTFFWMPVGSVIPRSTSASFKRLGTTRPPNSWSSSSRPGQQERVFRNGF